MKRSSVLGLALTGALSVSAAWAASDVPVRGSKVKAMPSEILYNPRFGTMISAAAEHEAIRSAIYNPQTGEISLGGEFDPRTGKRLAAAPPAAPQAEDPSVPMRGTTVKGRADEIRYNPRFGTEMVAASEREYVTQLVYDPRTGEISLNGEFDPRTGKRLRDTPSAAARGGSSPNAAEANQTPMSDIRRP